MLEHFENKHLSKLVVQTLVKLFYIFLTPLTISSVSEIIYFLTFNKIQSLSVK